MRKTEFHMPVPPCARKGERARNLGQHSLGWTIWKFWYMTTSYLQKQQCPVASFSGYKYQVPVCICVCVCVCRYVCIIHLLRTLNSQARQSSSRPHDLLPPGLLSKWFFLLCCSVAIPGMEPQCVTALLCIREKRPSYFLVCSVDILMLFTNGILYKYSSSGCTKERLWRALY